jgi:PqqD family protein of HPr-rel-A system
MERWVVPRGTRLRWKQWDDAVVVYNSASGNTHLLNSTASAVLRMLENSPAAPEELVHELEEACRDVSPPELARRLSTLFSQLDEVGLIERTEGHYEA